MIESIVDQIASSLFSVCVTMELIPLIRCQRGGAAEMVGQRLEGKLKDYVANSSSSSSSSFYSSNFMTTGERGTLILVDRNLDLIPMLSHAWTYAALVHDVLAMKNNRVLVTVKFTHLF